MLEVILYFVQQLINGITIGSTYALIAIGYTMVYGIIGMINFAHGEIYMIGTYIAFMAITGLSMLGITFLPIVFIVALLSSILVSSTFGLAVERVAYRPLRGGNRLIPLISAIGMSFFLQNYVRISQGARDLALQQVVTGTFTFGPEDGFQASISYMQIIIFIVTLISMTALTTFISQSRLGRACRATAQDLKMAGLLGINTNNVIAATFVIGAALAAVAGTLLGMYYGVANAYIGFLAGLKAFTAAVLGGIGSLPGALLGGLILGIAESMTAAYFSTEYKDVVSFGLLVLILLFKPTGILGKPEVEKI